MNKKPLGNYENSDPLAIHPTDDSYTFLVLFKPQELDSDSDYITAWYTNGQPYSFSCANIHEIPSSGRIYVRKGRCGRFYLDEFIWY